MNPLIPLKTTSLLLITLALLCFELSPKVQAVVPAPDGGYPGGNTAEGQKAVLNLTTGTFNSALGFFSLSALTAGNFCTGVGAGALLLNTADGNTAVGAAALLSNTIGSGNTATGLSALGNNMDGIRNTANGVYALNHNISGGGNTAVGYQALVNNTASSNTAVGNDSLVNNTTGSGNVAIGAGAGNGITISNNVICIASAGVEHDNMTWVGNIWNVNPLHPNVAPVVVSDHGQLCVQPSSERFKKDISAMGKASETILSLRPVTFHYKNDAKDTAQFGLIAEEVAKVNPALVLPDKDEKPFTVRYDQVNAMLLNEFLKEHRRIEDLKKNFQATIAQQQKEIKALAATVKQQAVLIQRVSAQIELTKASPRTALNDQ